MKKHVNPAKHLHEVYTMQGGVKEYNKISEPGVRYYLRAAFFYSMR